MHYPKSKQFKKPKLCYLTWQEVERERALPCTRICLNEGSCIVPCLSLFYFLRLPDNIQRSKEDISPCLPTFLFNSIGGALLEALQQLPSWKLLAGMNPRLKPQQICETWLISGINGQNYPECIGEELFNEMGRFVYQKACWVGAISIIQDTNG